MQRMSVPAYFGLLFLSVCVAAALPIPMASATSAPSPTSGSVGAAAPEQDWWMCRYQDAKDLSNPALGSRMYYALFPSGAASNGPNGLNTHFNAYVQQNYKVNVDVSGGKGFCVRISNDAAGRANSMDMFLKQWASSNIQSVRVNWAEAATPQPTAAPNGGPFIACSTSGGAGIESFVTGVFQTAYPVKYLPNGGHLVDQSVLDRFYAYLTQKGYHFKPGSNYGCVVEPTEARAIAAQHKRYVNNGCSNCGKVVETEWKDTP